jgi:N-acetylmuramic acid 6-phosphate etherase
MSTARIVELMNRQDEGVAKAVRKALRSIGAAVDLLSDRFQRGGRIFFVGAGTSGRLGVLEAVECIPTFGLRPGRVVGLLAGGNRALTRPVEGAEDDRAEGSRRLRNARLTPSDAVVGIAASGVTPFVVGALSAARKIGAATILVSCNRPSTVADVLIHVKTGPEVLAGSTRLKAGTGTKMVLNMLTTSLFVRLGKCYQNLMVDVRPTSQKLRDRARRIVMRLTRCSASRADEALREARGRVKVAVLLVARGIGQREAERYLQRAGDRLREALREKAR